MNCLTKKTVTPESLRVKRGSGTSFFSICNVYSFSFVLYYMSPLDEKTGQSEKQQSWKGKNYCSGENLEGCCMEVVGGKQLLGPSGQIKKMRVDDNHRRVSYDLFIPG